MRLERMPFELPGEVYNILNHAKIVLGGCERQLSDAAQSRLAEWRRRRERCPALCSWRLAGQVQSKLALSLFQVLPGH